MISWFYKTDNQFYKTDDPGFTKPMIDCEILAHFQHYLVIRAEKVNLYHSVGLISRQIDDIFRIFPRQYIGFEISCKLSLKHSLLLVCIFKQQNLDQLVYLQI